MTDEELFKKIKGKRFVCMVRCSGEKQVDTSIPAQLDDLRNVGVTHGGMPAGDDIILPALSGSKPGNRTDFEQSTKRKQDRNDFDIILTLSEDRFTRGGSDHGVWAEYELIRHGIQVIHVRSDVPPGPFAPFLRVMKYEAARETAKNTSHRSSMQVQRQLEAGNISTCSHTPYGLFRLYVSSEGQERFLVRDHRDGTQSKLDFQTREVLETLGTVGGKGDRFKKQKSDRSFLYPGDPKEHDRVALIMQRRWAEGLGGFRIAKEFNAMGSTAPCGGPWTQRQVDVIAENPIYFGVGIGNLKGGPRFFRRAKGGPRPVEWDPTVLATSKILPIDWYPIEDRTEREEPYLRDYLPESLRAIALPKIRALLERRALHEAAPRIRNPHIDSLYVLTGLFQTEEVGKDEDMPRFLVGHTCGPQGHKTRYYAHPIARKDPQRAGFPNTTFRADVLEKALLDVVAEVLLAADDLRPEISAIVEAEMAARIVATPPDAEQLNKELARLNAKIKMTFEMATPETMPDAKSHAAALGQKRKQLEAQIAQAAQPPETPLDVEAVTASVVATLKDLAGQLPSLPVPMLKELLTALTESLTGSMHTREVCMTLRLPKSAISGVKKGLSDLCLPQNSRSQSSWQAQNTSPAVLARITCDYAKEKGKQCFRCRRMRVAA